MNKKTATTVSPAASTSAPTSLFSRKIGNTTYFVSVAFNENARESIQDKIVKLVANDCQMEVESCS